MNVNRLVQCTMKCSSMNFEPISIIVPSQKRAHYGISAHPHFVLNFLLRSSVYSNMCPCVAALENAAQMANLCMRTEF